MLSIRFQGLLVFDDPGNDTFSDGVEADFLQFNSGSSVIVRAAAETAQLVVG
jgi:hypothetical protein